MLLQPPLRKHARKIYVPTVMKITNVGEVWIRLAFRAVERLNPGCMYLCMS